MGLKDKARGLSNLTTTTKNEKENYARKDI